MVGSSSATNSENNHQQIITNMIRILSVFFCLLFLSPELTANVRLPRIIGDNMVVQQNKPVKVWGWADAGENVKLRFNGQTKEIKASRAGKWEIMLSPMKQGGPFEMLIEGKNSLTVKNILIGEVWLCSGQSNMEWPMTRVNNSAEEIGNANFNEIRIFHVPQNVQFKPSDDIPKGEWKVVTPENIAGFSAVGYFFGKNLYEKYKFPVGLISSSWGGTDIETWMSLDVFSSVNGFEKPLVELTAMDEEKLKKDLEAKVKAMQGFIRSATDGLVDGKALWADPKLDDSSWDVIPAPMLWEQGPLPDVDGVVWYRKTIVLTKEQAAKEAILYLGKIDDSDISWINGNLAGQTEQKYDMVREYPVPAHFLKEGKNLITVRVEDTGGGGGIWGEEKQLRMETSAGPVSLAGDWKFQLSPYGFRVNGAAGNPNAYPTLLFNGMINPVKDFTMQGAIWYQGENNASRAKTYRTLFPLMINNWRKQFNNPELAFLYVQLANFMEAKDEPGESWWAELREAQNKALSLPKVGAAVTIDIGDPDDIHPRNKKDVGYRLSLPARKLVYGDDVVYSGPVYKAMESEGDKLKLTFDHIGGGLITKNESGNVMGFQIAGADKQFYWAKGRIEGNKVVVFSEQVKKPVSVRYAWSDNPQNASLYNKEGLPASPFRTDDWPGVTQ
jgi:sialate O-acetylesterase